MNLKLLNYSVITVDQTTSTNSLLNEMRTNHDLPNGVILLAKNQTQGKGQRGNKWIAQKGQNLTASIFIETSIKSHHAFYLNIITSLAIYKCLEDLSIISKIKWPNDILINEKKIAGILIENQLHGKTVQSSIIGIGININQTDFIKNLNATSLKLITDKTFEINEVLKIVYQYLDFYFNLLRESNFTILKKHYLNHLYQINRTGLFEDKNGKFHGKITGIDEFGKLLVRKNDDKTYSYDIQEISYL